MSNLSVKSGIGEINLGQELLNVPMGEMIKQMALAIAEGQWELDKSSMTVAELMSGQRLLRNIDTGQLINPMPDGSPRTIDSRVYFGYTYEEDGEKTNSTYASTFTQEAFDPIEFTSTDVNNGKDKEVETLINTTYKGSTSNEVISSFADAVNALDITNTLKDKINGALPSPKEVIENIPIMVRKPNKLSMMELGFTPSFYQFVDTIIEVRIAIKITGTTEHSETNSEAQADVDEQASQGNKSTYSAGGHSSNSRSWWWGNNYHNWGYANSQNRQTNQRKRQTVSTSQVDASYANKYSYSAEGSSLLRTKLTPIPPPAILEERIREVMALERDYLDKISSGQIVAKY